MSGGLKRDDEVWDRWKSTDGETDTQRSQMKITDETRPQSGGSSWSFCPSSMPLTFFLFLHSHFLSSVLNICFSFVSLFDCPFWMNFFSRFSLFWLSLFCPLFSPYYIPSCHSKKHVFLNTFRFCCLLFLKKKNKETVVFSYFLFSPVHYEKLLFNKNFVLTFFETSAFFSKKNSSLSPPTNATRSLFERLLCLLTLSFCSSSIHLFSFFGLSVFFPFRSPFFSHLWIFHWSWISLCFPHL